MFIFQNGASISNDDYEIKGKVLVADIFEKNIDLKAMIVFDSVGLDEAELMQKVSDCTVFKCIITSMNTIFECKFEDVTIDADYCNGSVVRFFIHIEDYESHEIIAESEKERNKRMTILRDVNI